MLKGWACSRHLLLCNQLCQAEWLETTTILFIDSLGKEFGQYSAGQFFCPTWYQLMSLGGSQLMEWQVWWVQDGFMRTTGTLGWLGGWAQLGLPTGVLVHALLSMAVPGFLHGSSKLPGDPGRNCKLFQTWLWKSPTFTSFTSSW